jgi:hypothetical protein
VLQDGLEAEVAPEQFQRSGGGHDLQGRGWKESEVWVISRQGVGRLCRDGNEGKAKGGVAQSGLAMNLLHFSKDLREGGVLGATGKGEQEDEGAASHALQENDLGACSNRDQTGDKKRVNQRLPVHPSKRFATLLGGGNRNGRSGSPGNSGSRRGRRAGVPLGNAGFRRGRRNGWIWNVEALEKI